MFPGSSDLVPLKKKWILKLFLKCLFGFFGSTRHISFRAMNISQVSRIGYEIWSIRLSVVVFSTSRLGFTYRGGPAVRNYDLRTEGREPELHAIIPWTVLNWLCTGQWFMQEDSLTPTALPFYSQQCLQAVILCWSYPASRLGKPLAHITNWMIE